MNIKEKAVGFKKNMKKHGLLFHCNIRAYTLLGIHYVSVIRIPCRCSACLRKLISPWKTSEDKYIQDRYKSDNQNYVHWPILGSYNNWKISHCIDCIKVLKSTNSNINVHIKQNSIKNISFNIFKGISDNYYEEISK